jgi:hypothetical protein
MRNYLLSLSSKSQFFIIILGTISISFISALIIDYLFGSMELVSKAGLITAIYAVLGTIYAVLVAFSVSGVWQNYCASETAVTSEVAALIDLVHMVQASTSEKAELIKSLAINYMNEVISTEWNILALGRIQDSLSFQSKTFTITARIINEVQTIEPVNARDNVIFSHVLMLMTKWLDARRTRLMLSIGNIAKALWPLLIAGAVILSAFHGLFITREPILWSTLLLFFSSIIGLSFYLIFTLDCPFAGTPAVDSGPFKWALALLTKE